MLKLCDLEADPGETVNLAGKGECESVISRLRERLLRWHLAAWMGQGS